MRLKIAAAAGAALLTLAACGGEDEDAGNNQWSVENELNAFNMMAANETNGAVPDEIEGNTPADNRNIKTGDDSPADANAAAPVATPAAPKEDDGEVESNVSGM